MGLGVWLLGLSVAVVPVLGQDCAPTSSILSAGTVSASLDGSSCSLADGTPYAAYRLDLPVRGRIQIDLDASKSSTAAGLLLILRDGSGAQIDASMGIHRLIEAGNYTVLVNAQTSTPSAAYSITTAFTPEPGMLCSGFPNIGLNQAVAGTLPSAGCTAPDGTAYEAYTLTSGGVGTLTVTIESSDFSPVVMVRGADGHALTASANTVNADLSADSQYVLVVSAADSSDAAAAAGNGATAGAYRLTTAFAPADAETCRPTGSFTNTGSDSTGDNGAVTTASCFVTFEESGDQAYYNYYSFTLAKAGILELSAVSADFTASLYLLDAAGNTLASDTGGGGYDPALAITSALRLQLSPGSYTVQLFSDVPTGGKYSFHYAFTANSVSPSGAPNTPQSCAASAMNPGDASTGQISSASCRTSLGWGDLYRMTLPSAGTLNLDLSSAQFDTVLAIRDAKDNLVVRNQQTGVSHIAADLPAGAYTIVAAAGRSSGAYQLISKFTAHDIPACATAQALDINGGYIQRLGPASCRGANGQPVDYYQFTLPADSVVAAVMTSAQVDGYLTLLDFSGTVLRTDDNSYGSGDPLIVQYLAAGTYKLAARDAAGTAGGLYEIDIRTVMGPRPPFCAPKSTVALDSTVTGAVSFSGCQYDETFADIYQINLTSDGAIDVRLNSSDFDAYLVLMDAKGNVVDEDDDSGGGTNARLTTSLAAGSYYVVAKPLGDYTAQGSYSLSVAQAQ